MEGGAENSNDTKIPKKSRSLDLKSLYKSKMTGETAKKNLKRRGGSPGVGDEKRKRKKARKEVSLSSLENDDGGRKNVLDDECPKGSGSGKHDRHGLKLGVSQRLSSSVLNRVSLSIGGGDVVIPRRKRNLVGRKKSGVGQALNLAAQPSCKVGHDQVLKLGGDDLGRGIESLKTKHKKEFDEFKENRNSDSNSVQNFKENGDHASHSVVNSGDSTLTKPQRKNRKRKTLGSHRTKVSKDAEPLADSYKISDDLQEDEEENLEENAAMMLSSRFDPNCTGFSSNSKSSVFPSANDLSFFLSPSQNIVNQGSKSQSGSESASGDTAGRVLRPRKQYKDKGNSRKRRHYYEILLGDVGPYWVLKRKIKIFWPLDQSWYYGLVDNYDEKRKAHHIKYDDRDEEWIDLHTERFKLLLLRSEVPGNARGGRALTKSRSSDDQNGSKSRKEMQRREEIAEDDSCGGSFMDSEPIISWLARSSNRLKSSFQGIKKQKSSVALPSTASTLLYDEPVPARGHSAKISLKGVKNNLLSDSLSQDKLSDSFTEKSSLQSFTCTKDRKQPIVYYRRRFRRPAPISPVISEENHAASGSLSTDHMVSGVMTVKEPSDSRVEVEGPLWLTFSAGVLEVYWDLESASLKFDLNLVLNDSFLSELWFLHTALLLQYGTVMIKWPRVCLEMLFVDNVVGLRFLLFEGCLNAAAAFVFFILRVFHQPACRGKYDDLQFPVTSIGFKFSSVHVVKKPLVFAFYNSSRVKNSEWEHLDSKLKRHCLLSKQLHLSECTYDNIQALRNGSSEFSGTSMRESSSVKVLHEQVKQKRIRPGISIMGVSKVSTQADTQQFSDAGEIKLPPFALSFAAAPTFFLCLHLNLLMEQSATQISFSHHAPIDDQENSGLMTDGCTSTDDCSNRNSEISLKKDVVTLSNGAAGVGWFCAESDQIVDHSTCSDQIISENYQNIALNCAGSYITHGSERLGSAHVPEWEFHHSEQELGSLPSSSVIHQDKADDGSHSFIGDLSIQIPIVDQFERPGDGDSCGAQHSPDFSWNKNGSVLPSSNPTARRSSWYRNRNPHGWSDGKADSLYNDFSNGPRKPRTQVSYSVPSAGDESSSKNRGNNQKKVPNKKIRKASEKKSSDIAKGKEMNFEDLHCDVNVLITFDDKGWREPGGQVVLELFEQTEWRLCVKILGVTRYSYKALQFMQPGSPNRFSHAIFWRGGKDWALEFPVRKSYHLFRQMYEECYNRNFRASQVKNIPIPGVRLIEENDGNESEVPFVRGSRYYQQVETDAQMALNPSRVLYDMDSEDEQWISSTLNFKDCNTDSNRFSGAMFEKTMDWFEKVAYSQQHDQFTPEEIEDFMGVANVGPLSVVNTIYEYWWQKRQKKGRALIRHFQPPPWEIYQQRVREWEVNRRTRPNLEKPLEHAFCRKPRDGSHNTGLKHRSQKKMSVPGQAAIHIEDQDGFYPVGRRANGLPYGDERLEYPGHGYDFLDDSPMAQTSPRIFSPRDAGSMRYYPTSNGVGGYRIPDLQKKKAKMSNVYLDDSYLASSSRRIPAFELRNDYSYMASSSRMILSDPDGGDAFSVAEHKRNIAKLKRERAQRLLNRADMLMHRAVAALMVAEAKKASEVSVGDPE
ncbi:hypothetical protein RJT34_16468 [Clitoria ternatea]|uniref:Enhancer of polycomb-like protein n=1 Tax=Clitoria ternatea TaxID=43366 RepID=A0AAN9PCC2_CLITE